MLASIFQRAVFAAALVMTASAGTAPARALELVMFERSGCPWCLRWDKEVSPVYSLTPEGARAPLRRVNLDGGQPRDLALDPPVRFTPTFVLVDKGREIGRITGYMNDATFWGLLTKMIPASTEQGGPGGGSVSTRKAH